jgi:N-methylhydantoinase A/oxoprolinase/acetone carboxylase beta subunit
VIRIGIDVGGTNTDAVVVDGTRVVASLKTSTTEDVTTGVQRALAKLIESSPGAARAATAVIVGTTHFVNAVVERKELERVASLRLCLPASASVKPFAGWPSDLRDLVRGDVVLLPGGHEIDGREISPFDPEATYAAARRIATAGIEAVAISSVFSPIRADHENQAAAIVRETIPGVRVTLSRDLGRLGLLERENVALLNAALGKLARKTTAAFREAIRTSGLNAKLYLTQNDGTVISAETAEQYPVLCFASGPTNSMRGAAFLSGMTDAAVVDVGGTTSDIGILKNGFPREANSVVNIGGVRTLFRMPDVVSLALGGGTRVYANPFRLGPDSLGFRLLEKSLIFGGADLCTTDVAVAQGLLELGDPMRVRNIDPSIINSVCQEAQLRLEEGVDRLKTSPDDIPLIAVGGGSFLVPKSLRGVSEVVFVRHHDVANAIGAAIAQISGEVDQVFTELSRDEAIASAVALARSRAEQAGAAANSVNVVDVEELPLAYMPGSTRRVRVRVVGELAQV